MALNFNQSRWRTTWSWLFVFGFASVLFLGSQAFAQEDQAAITGTVADTSGGSIPAAQVTLTDTDTGLILHEETNSSGNYVFSPVKIGNYKVSATAQGFQTTTQEHVHLSIQQRLNVNIVLRPGVVSQTVTITAAPPLLQTQSASVGQVVSAETIDRTPLNGRNWVFIAQLTAGTVPSTSAGSGTGSQASRGGGTGDFFANGLRATQNNFILDGIDNNVNVADFTNGASYSIRPPPDALAEFEVNTSDYSAEFGHSAGAVINASIKSGTNQVHGAIWEYFRNTHLDAQDWDQTSIPPYHENQFGATAGFPILKNRLFYFGDAEANLISSAQPLTLSVPTALMRQGNFSELQSTSLTGQAQAIQLYEPNSGGTAKLSCNGQNNVFCPSQIDPVARTLLNLFPLPNTNGGRTYNNYSINAHQSNNNWMWDQRVDWDISAKDQGFIRYSYDNEHFYNAPPLGNLLLGISDYPAFQGTLDANLIQQFDLSETHIFSPTLVNSFRFGYSYGHYTYEWPNSNVNVAAQLGLGGVPFDPSKKTAAIPVMTVSSISAFGPSTSQPSNEDENDPQLLDNLTKTVGNHSLKFGAAFLHLQIGLFQPASPTGHYTYNGLFTSNLGASFTGYGVADLLANQMDTGSISTDTGVSDTRWYDSAYAQDDWRATHSLTLNFGVRWDFFQPMTNSAGDISNLVPSTQFGSVGQGSGTLLVPAKDQSKNLFPAAFTSLLAKDNVTIQYVNSTSLVLAPKANFSPRLGFAYQLPGNTVIRSGYGMFYGGLESVGGQPIMVNYPWEFSATIVAPTCTATSCNANGITLENGFATQLAGGIQNFVSTPVFNVSVYHSSIPYSEEWNLAVEHQFRGSMAATLAYIGNIGEHLEVNGGFDTPDALVNPASNSQLVKPFPDITASGSQAFDGSSNYNGVQAKLQKTYSGSGLNFLATYTLAHALDDSRNSGGIETGVTYRNLALIPIADEYTNSSIDVRHRFTFNGSYQLPFGRGLAHMNKGGWSNEVAGGWSGSLVFLAQTGVPFTVTPDITTAAGGSSARAIRIADPFKAGGTPPASNLNITCAQTTRNRSHWYNPCAFANPLPGTNIPISGPGSQVTGTANAIAYLGGKANTAYGPGFERVNVSFFKNFPLWREQYLQFRVDSFNLFNHPTLNVPSVLTNNTNGGQITQSDIFQPDTPDSRFFQFSLKYTY